MLATRQLHLLIPSTKQNSFLFAAGVMELKAGAAFSSNWWKVMEKSVVNIFFVAQAENKMPLHVILLFTDTDARPTWCIFVL